MTPLKIPVAEIPALTNESLAVVYDAINAGHLRTFLVGRRRFARPDAVQQWVEFLEAQSDAGRPVVYRPRRREIERARVKGSDHGAAAGARGDDGP